MKAGLLYLKYSFLPVCIVVVAFFVYVKTFCHFSNVSADADLVCAMNWKDGIFLVSSYVIVKLLSPLIGLKRKRARIVATLFLYSFSFGIFAFLYWITAFGQPFARNVFLHFFLIILIVEGVFDYYS